MSLPGPELITPARRAEVNSGSATFAWREVPGATAYWVQVARDPAFTDPILDMYVGAGNTARLTNLPSQPGAQLYWRMRTRDTDGWGDFGEATEFTYIESASATPVATAVPAGPAVPQSASVLLTPEEGAPVEADAATFVWQAVSGAREYELQIAREPGFKNLVFDRAVGDSTSLTLFETLPEDGNTYYWRVRASDHEGWRPWSDAGSFVAETDEVFERYVSERALRTTAAARIEARSILENEPSNIPFHAGTTSKGLATATLAVMLLSFIILMVVLVQLALDLR